MRTIDKTYSSEVWRRTAFSDGCVHAAKARVHTRSDHKFIQALAFSIAIAVTNTIAYNVTSYTYFQLRCSFLPEVYYIQRARAARLKIQTTPAGAAYPAWHVPPVLYGRFHACYTTPRTRSKPCPSPKRPLHTSSISSSSRC